MQALRTQIIVPGFLSKPRRFIRYYLDGKRVSRDAYDMAHHGRTTDTYTSHIVTRKRDGAEIMREYHCIRVTQS